MDAKYFAEIKAREQAATPGPWSIDTNEPFSRKINGVFSDSQERYVFYHDPDEENTVSQKDSAFIAHARTDIPALIAEVERLTEENESLAVNGGKYMEIAQKRYEMFEKASKRAENAEITNTAKDQQIATLKAAKDEINRYNIDCTKQCDKLLVENATLKKALEMMADKLYKSAGCPWYESLDYFGLPNPFQECDKCGKEMSEMPQCWIEYFMQQAQEREGKHE